MAHTDFRPNIKSVMVLYHEEPSAGRRQIDNATYALDNTFARRGMSLFLLKLNLIDIEIP